VNTLQLEQIGSKNIVLTPVPASFSVANQAWTGTSTVNIAIDPAVAQNPSLNEDGDVLVANLRMTTPGGSRFVMSRTCSARMSRGLPAAKMNPSASAPIATAAISRGT